LRPVQRWTDPTRRYSLWLLERPPFIFTLKDSRWACNSRGELIQKKSYSSSPYGVPSPQDWQNMWAAWDFVTLRMIPPSMLFQKPIDLRHICLFYLGHIPTFLDIHLSRLLNEPHTEPEAFKDIFEVRSSFSCYCMTKVLTMCSEVSIPMWMIPLNAMYVTDSILSPKASDLPDSFPSLTPKFQTKQKTGPVSHPFFNSALESANVFSNCTMTSTAERWCSTARLVVSCS